jgi:2-oxoglutarate ferredoxin oxidoreductase subunit alpha
MKMDLDPQRVSKLRSVRYFGGMPLDARTVTDDIINQEGLI